MTVLDHLSLLDRPHHRKLIEMATSGADVAYLAPLDKGLSGASVWQARWLTPLGTQLTNTQVLKIGDLSKLRREYEAVTVLASTIDRKTPRTTLYELESESLALLRSDFVSDKEVHSFRDHVRHLTSVDETIRCVNELFGSRMESWHYSPHARGVRFEQPLRVALDWWFDRRDVVGCADRLGRRGAESLVQSLGVASVDALALSIEALGDAIRTVHLGVVHGDLHTQNVLLDEDGFTYLIDFGWTAERWRAIDFLMMEASLKFLVAPRSARMTDLCRLDDVIDSQPWGDLPDPGELASWGNQMLYGETLARVAAAVTTTRYHASASGAVEDERLYREGLALLGAGLSSMPHTINLGLVLASTARQVAVLT